MFQQYKHYKTCTNFFFKKNRVNNSKIWRTKNRMRELKFCYSQKNYESVGFRT